MAGSLIPIMKWGWLSAALPPPLPATDLHLTFKLTSNEFIFLLFTWLVVPGEGTPLFLVDNYIVAEICFQLLTSLTGCTQTVWLLPRGLPVWLLPPPSKPHFLVGLVPTQYGLWKLLKSGIKACQSEKVDGALPQ